MQTTCVVVLRPFYDGLPRVIDAEEQGFVQQFVPHPLSS
jgi:hypothetical protein